MVPPMKNLPRRLVILSVLLVSIGCDQATKHLATTELRDTPSRSFLGDTFRLVYAENPGAFLGIGGQMGETARFWGFTVLVGLMLLGATVFLVLKGRELPGGHLAGLALLIGGGGSNWFDRLVNDGRVVDFLNLGIGSLRTGIFNVADVAIMGGALLIALAGKTPATTA